MTTIVEICNDALANIRGQSINSLIESSRESQLCALKFPLVRDKVLREIAWSFATKEEPLAQLTVELPRWRKCYSYPNNALAIQSLFSDEAVISAESRAADVTIYREDDRHPDYGLAYEVMSSNGDKVIGCNSNDVYARYTAKITDPNAYDPLFTMMLSWYLSSQLAIPLMGQGKGRAEKQMAMQEYEMLRKQAIKIDAEENCPQPKQMSEMITGRF